MMPARLFKWLPLVLTFALGAGEQPCAADEPEIAPLHLTLKEAQDLALRQNPRISVASLTALADEQATREARAAFYPTIVANATAAGADSADTRLAAGGLNNPSVFDRNAEGVSVSQLITDFGRTSALAKSAESRSRAGSMELTAARSQILLEVNNAYFGALEAQARLQVADQTVASRQLAFQQIQALATNQLKSELDVSFSAVDLNQAQLLQVRARHDVQAGFATLAEALGEPRPRTFQLVDEPMFPEVTNSLSALIAEALAQRPDLARLRFERDAAQQSARAEYRLSYPTLSAVGGAGVVPIGDSRLPDKYAAAGVNLSIPLFTGGLYAGRRREAELRAQAVAENVRAGENSVIREVQVAALNLELAGQQFTLTAKLLANADQAFSLAQARFKAGSASILELSQADVNRTSARIADADARYDYQIQHSALDFELGRLR